MSLMLQNYSLGMNLRNSDPTFELWIFAACYSLVELERYYRAHNDVLSEIIKLLCMCSKGIRALLFLYYQ